MAYAALISLKHTIERLLNSSDILLVPPSPEIIEFAYEVVKFLQKILKTLDDINSTCSNRKRVNALDGQIREALCKLEDVIESHVSNQILSQSESHGDETHPLLFSIDLQDLEQDIQSFTTTVLKMEEEYIVELFNPLLEEEEEEEEDDDAVSSRINFGGKKSKMVGLFDQFHEIKDQLMDHSDLRLRAVSLVGMAGIGKTTLAKEIFEDPDILKYFYFRAWVTVGRKCKLKEIPRAILAQVKPETDEMLTEGDEKIALYLKESLKDRRFLIVLDDVWDIQVCRYLERLIPNNDYRSRSLHDLISLFPEYNNGSRVLLTTRLQNVAQYAARPVTCVLNMRLLNKEESWDLFREKVFSEELCPPQLEKAGKKIAKICDGLPLTIAMVADLLSTAEKTPEYWNKVAEKQNSVFMDAYDSISKVLFPSYDYLPQYLKACFLYMGVFPQKYEIPRSKLFNMWIAEGFLEPKTEQTSEGCAMECLEEIISNSLVIVYQQRAIWSVMPAGKVKTCGLHSSFWHLCNKEAGKNNFFHVLIRAVGLAEGIKSQRRLCIHNNILFGIKDVYNSLENDCASTARSLLCYGSYHQYPVPICFSLRLLRVLDALTIRFYEFPMQVLKLIQLKYLAFTYTGKLPSSISKLWRLQVLIVRRHLSIKSSGDPSYLPMEIWDMKELKHLQIMGSDLPDTCGTLLPSLLTLSDVSAHSCTKGVLERIANLKKLGIRIELGPDAAEPLCCFDHISHLEKLESLKCVIVNPELRSEVVAPPATLSIFPSSLRKLTLSGLGYPWEYMSIIGSLPNLNVLKLRCYAFRGPKWETEENLFLRIYFLLIEDTDLVQWNVGSGSFPCLEHLCLKHCYKLQEIPPEICESLEKVEIVDCKHLAVTVAEHIEEVQWREEYSEPGFYVHSSWNEGNHKSGI